MADSSLSILQSDGSSATVDTRTETTNTQHRQVIVAGDPSTNANVAAVQNEDPGPTSTLQGVVVRLAGSATVQQGAAGTWRVFFDPATGLPAGANTIGSMAVFFTPSKPTVRVDVTDTISVKFVPETGLPAGINTLGSIAVFYSPSIPAIKDLSGTASLPSTASGTVNTAGGSGSNTLVSPEAGRNIKIFAYSLTTTGVVSISPRFTTGGSGGSTELWRVAFQAPASVGTGANLAIQPPGYLFATGVGNTLALFLDSATLVHYSVAYFKESA